MTAGRHAGGGKPGNDWLILQLAQPGRIRRVEVDTACFKGNYPARCSLHGAMLGNLPGDEQAEQELTRHCSALAGNTVTPGAARPRLACRPSSSK